MFQAKKWSWKRLAANLLLVPVLTGGSVAVVHAQLNRPNSGFGAAAPATPNMSSAFSGANAAPRAATAEPKQLLKDGRKALAEGNFAAAQDLAQAAEANNPGGKWGLFDDTPASLRKDIQSAQAKHNKTQSEQLVKQAKQLAAKPAANDAERAYNLDAALQMARRADQLHGPYSTWDMGDRADKLVKEITTARAKIKVAPSAGAVANTNTGAPANGNTTARGPGAPSGRQPGNTNANPGTQVASADAAKKQGAMKLMSEGRALADKGDFAAAKAKYTEADKLGATFAANEYNPGFALQELNARGTARMDQLVRDAKAASASGDHVKANVALTNAGHIATSLGLFAGSVTEAKAALFVASAGKYGAPSPSGLVAAGGPEHLIPLGPVGPAAPAGNKPPTLPPGTNTVYNGGTKPVAPVVPANGGSVTGRQLLDQAAIEFRAGEFETAEKLAVQAHNHGMQKEAAEMLNSIGAEKLARKQRAADQSVRNAKLAYEQKDYQRAFNVLVLVDPMLLGAEAKAARDQLFTACKAELDKTGTGTGLVTTGGMQPADKTPLPPSDPTMGTGTNPPGVARVGPDAKSDPASTADALRSVQFQKLRSEGLKVQSDAQAAFGRGETDLAMQLLIDYSNRVRSSGLDAGSIGRLMRPVDGRLETFRLMKGHADATARLNKEKRDARELITNRGVAEEDRKQAVAALVHRYHALAKKSEYAEAERVALQAKQLDPDDPAVGALYEMAKLARRVKDAERQKAQHDDFVLHQLNETDKLGPIVTPSDPVAIHMKALERSRGRGNGDSMYLKTRTPAEYEIELRLEKPISLQFNQTPLNEALKNIQQVANVPLWLDEATLRTEHISEVQPITFDPGTAIAGKNVLACILESSGLSYVIENDMVKVTSVKKAKGRMVTKVFSVADLVTPVPNFALPDYANYQKMLDKNPLNSGNLMIQGLNTPGPAPFMPAGGLGGGRPTGVSSTLPGELATTPGIQRQGGTLQTDNPLAASASVVGSNTKHEQLIKLITSMVRPFTWDGHGGGGKVEFFDIGSALVVNQTADVIQEVADLLEALRRLQDLAIAVEVRIVSLSESFYERMGLDFSINIKTNTTKFEPQLTSGTFRPQPFINDINATGVTLGLTPAGNFTPDLDIPIRTNTFNRAIPAFGGFQNTPGDNGGIALGLAFLNDIQVYTFMEMAQGDRRINVMQAPKITLFNGQTATLSAFDQQFYVANVQVISVNGQLVFVPQNTPFPGGGVNVSITIQAVVSADRRFVRLNLPVNLTTNSSTAVPLFPITTFITPVFEGGSQGQPIPFTQFLQQPTFTNLNISTTVVCPDGGTVLLGGLKTLSEGRNEFGPPFLSKIPYLSRLFKNVGVGRESTHVMIMVTPRIIITSEEEIFQTEGRQPTQ